MRLLRLSFYRTGTATTAIPYNGAMIRRIMVLLGVATLLALSANAISPRSLPWKEPLGKGLAAQVASAGFVVVERKSIKGLLENPSVLFVDARPPEEYTIGRIPRAVNVPPSHAAGTTALTKTMDQPIVVYCANEFCASALEVASQFQIDGRRNIAIFVDGYDAWWNGGGAVEQE